MVGTAEELTESPTLDSYTDHAGYQTFVQNAQGRPSEWVVVTAEEVRLVIGVEPKQGAQECPSNPATPVTVDLPEPVGDRVVVDAAVYPPKRVTPTDRS